MSESENPFLQGSIGGKTAGSSTQTDALDAYQKNTLRNALIDSARKLLGIPYEYGAEWLDYAVQPLTLDCSELTEGIYRLNGLKCPDGSQNQFNFFYPTTVPLPGDLAFFGRGGKIDQIYHVGMLFDNFNIIEARGYDPGASFETGKVILRQRQKWENYLNFAGYKAHPKLF